MGYVLQFGEIAHYIYLYATEYIIIVIRTE